MRRLLFSTAISLALAVSLGLTSNAHQSLTGAGARSKTAGGGGSNNCGGTGTIAVDTAWASGGANWGWDTGGGTTTRTFPAQSIAGSNRELLVGIITYQGETVSSINWNTSEALTKIASVAGAVEGNAQNTELWGLKNPTTGSHVVTVVFASNPTFAAGVAATYTGVNQTTPIFSSNTGVNNSNSAAETLGTAATGGNNCWLAGITFYRPSGGTASAGTGTVVRIGVGDAIANWDSNGTVTAGTPQLAWTASPAFTWPGKIVVTLAPTP